MSRDPASAAEIVQRLGLAPHPEGGHFRETFRDGRHDAAGRAASSAILYLLAAGEVSAWHRIDAAEIWHFHAGAALDLSISPDGGAVSRHRLGVDFEAGEHPQAVVPAGHWQSATSRGAWTLVGCTVAPGFVYETFEMAAAGWQPASLRSAAP